MNNRRLSWRLTWREGGLIFARIESKTPVLRPTIQSNQSSLRGLHCSADRGEGGLNGQIVSIKRAADGRRQKSREIIDQKRGKYKAKYGSMRNTSTDSKRTTFVILINHASALVTKERLNPMSKARRQASRNEFIEKGGMPDGVKSFGEINSGEDRPRTRLGFVKPIREELSKKQNLI